MVPIARRELLAAGASTLAAGGLHAQVPRKAQIVITLDLEMSRSFPRREDTHWDYEKGNLNGETKRYAREAGRRVKARGGVVHYFVVGRVLEQEDVGWLRELAVEGHPLGNHTYDHVNVLATRPEELQFRFRRAPWLIEGKTPQQVIDENIRVTTAAMKARLGVSPSGFRTPGGFASGLRERPDLRRMLREQGFSWISSLYPAHPVEPDRPPDAKTLDGIVLAQAAAQPFTYPDGLIEVPMSPVSDVNAFRTGRWSLGQFLQAVRLAVEWAVDQRAVFDFLAHPSCLYVTDPELRCIDLICDLVEQSRGRAELTGLDRLASRASRSA